VGSKFLYRKNLCDSPVSARSVISGFRDKVSCEVRVLSSHETSTVKSQRLGLAWQWAAAEFAIQNTPIRQSTVRTRIIGPHARTLELPLLVRSGSFFFLFCLKLGLRGSVFAVRSTPYPREGISDVLAPGPIIRVLTVLQKR